MNQNGEKPAFPLSAEAEVRLQEGYGFAEYCLGLSKREEFAKAAMQGLLSKPFVAKSSDIATSSFNEIIASRAVLHADALLLALDKRNFEVREPQLTDYCKKNIGVGDHHIQCMRKRTIDGYCSIHHPAAEQRRQESERDG